MHHALDRTGDQIIAIDFDVVEFQRSSVRSVQRQQSCRRLNIDPPGRGCHCGQNLSPVVQCAAGHDIVGVFGTRDPRHKAVEHNCRGRLPDSYGRPADVLPRRRQMGEPHGGEQIIGAQSWQQRGFECLIVRSGDSLTGAVALREHERGDQAGFCQFQVSARQFGWAKFESAKLDRYAPAGDARQGKSVKLPGRPH